MRGVGISRIIFITASERERDVGGMFGIAGGSGSNQVQFRSEESIANPQGPFQISHVDNM